MDGAAGAVSDQLAHRQGLVNQALAGERGVPVHQDAHDGAPARHVAGGILPGADLADHDGIDRFEVRWVRLQRDMDHSAVDLDVGAGAEMIFDVAGALNAVRLGTGARELTEDGGERLAHDVDERVEAAAMRHADRDLVDASGGGDLDDGVQRGNGDLSAFKTEALSADETLLAERLEALGLGELGQDRCLGLHIEAASPGSAFRCAAGSRSSAPGSGCA